MSCIDSGDDCTYLQVLIFNFSCFQRFTMTKRFLFQNNAAIAAGSLFSGFAFVLFVLIVAIVRSCSMEQIRISVKSSQIDPKLSAIFAALMMGCATVLGCVAA